MLNPQDDNIYTGIRKKLPAEGITMADVNTHLRGQSVANWKTPEQQRKFMNFNKLAYHGFPSCCGACIITGFPYDFGGAKNISDGFDYKEVKIDPKVSKTGWLLMADDLLTRLSDRENYYKSYVMCYLNTGQMKAGNAELLVDYLGFARLEDDFVNKSGSPNVGLFGLCLNKYGNKNGG